MPIEQEIVGVPVRTLNSAHLPTSHYGSAANSFVTAPFPLSQEDKRNT
jgi:hypothetical protein